MQPRGVNPRVLSFVADDDVEVAVTTDVGELEVLGTRVDSDAWRGRFTRRHRACSGSECSAPIRDARIIALNTTRGKYVVTGK
jgi:hypothetical protein